MPSFLGIWTDLELKFTFNFRSTLHLTFTEKSTTVWLIEGKITPEAEERSSCWKRLTRQNLPSYGAADNDRGGGGQFASQLCALDAELRQHGDLVREVVLICGRVAEAGSNPGTGVR